jgi:hypothetical protein
VLEAPSRNSSPTRDVPLIPSTHQLTRALRRTSVKILTQLATHLERQAALQRRQERHSDALLGTIDDRR